jgi:hypothetical protein
VREEMIPARPRHRLRHPVRKDRPGAFRTASVSDASSEPGKEAGSSSDSVPFYPERHDSLQSPEVRQFGMTNRKPAAAEARPSRPGARSRRLRHSRHGILRILAAGIACVSLLLCSVTAGAVRTLLPENPASKTWSAAAERWRPEVRAAAERYGIAAYTDLILAVMTAESGGEGGDPMQASACPYNKKYPGEITDPIDSIDCGVHYLADCLQAARVSSPSDLEHIRLALQGYNYGNGYISWAVARDGGYTRENAELFSRVQRQQRAVDVYGNPDYCAAVLQYYPLAGLAGNCGGAAAMISCAAGEIGTKEAADGTTQYGRWYGLPDGDWCVMFLSWCADACGLVQAGLFPKAAGCETMQTWFSANGQWHPRDAAGPLPGDILFFDWDGDQSPDHVGLAELCGGDTVQTIEGNASDCVCRRTYSIDGRILGWGRPAYP